MSALLEHSILLQEQEPKKQPTNVLIVQLQTVRSVLMQLTAKPAAALLFLAEIITAVNVLSVLCMKNQTTHAFAHPEIQSNNIMEYVTNVMYQTASSAVQITPAPFASQPLS